MRILVLGGTVFLGRHVVDAARARGHEITLFNRGQSNADLFPDLENLRGDRDGGLDVLRAGERKWDAVIDTCGFVPRLVRASAECLRDAAEHYIFVSTQSVYSDADPDTVGQDESAALATIEDETVEQVTGETYGALKALCERAAEEAMPGRVTNVRSGLIVGPHDPSDRFTYWPVRVAAGGEVLAPAPPDWPVEFVDARDLAAWIVHAAEQKTSGTFNTAGPTTPRQQFGRLLAACREVAGNDATITWAALDWLEKRGATPWADLPLRATERAFTTRTPARAMAAGFECRPMEQTIRDTHAWAQDTNRNMKTGLTRKRETELLQDWHACEQSPDC